MQRLRWFRRPDNISSLEAPTAIHSQVTIVRAIRSTYFSLLREPSDILQHLVHCFLALVEPLLFRSADEAFRPVETIMQVGDLLGLEGRKG